MLALLVVGQQHLLADVIEFAETGADQDRAEGSPSMLRMDQDILEVHDRHVVGEAAGQADQLPFVVPGRHHIGRAIDGPSQTIGVTGVDEPTDRGVQIDQFGDRDHLVIGQVVAAGHRSPRPPRRIGPPLTRPDDP